MPPQPGSLHRIDNTHTEPTRLETCSQSLTDGFQETSSTTLYEEAAVTADSSSAISLPNCASIYCERHHLRSDQFVESLFWKTLYPRARFFGFPIILLMPRIFSADRDFITQVGQVETMEQYKQVEEYFHRWPGCRSFLRGKLGLRVTSRRVRRLVEELLTHE